ncbi:MAG: Crp/Fnr family transcriptional regulator [Clostridiales bacterium]|nr:Crp/Fnr family transcriptional regulator [Clostridiales bacterium]
MENLSSALENCLLFSGMTAEETGHLLSCLGARQQTYQKGSYLLRAGDTTGMMGLLLEGRVSILQEDFWGNRNLMARIRPGQLFAESFAAAPETPLNVSAAAEEKCGVLWLDVQRILTTCPNACAYHSRMIRNLLTVLAEKNLRFNEKLTHMGQRTTREKLLSYLSAQAAHDGSAAFDIPFDRQELADYLCVERSAMSAALGRLREEGVLQFHKNHFILYQYAQR